MRIKTFIRSLMIFDTALYLAGCGKAELPAGDAQSDSSLLGVGCFEESVVDTSFIRNEFSAEAVYSDTESYSYIFDSYDSVLGQKQYYYLNLDIHGNIIADSVLNFPVIKSDEYLIFTDDFKELPGLPAADSYDECNIYYYNSDFDDNGNPVIVGELSGYIIPEDVGYQEFINIKYLFTFDTDGNCKSADVLKDDVQVSYDLLSGISSSDGISYKICANGITRTSDDGYYLSVYFDEINSGVDIGDYQSACILNDSSFSCIYKDDEGKNVLSCFNAFDPGRYSDKKAIVIGCTGLSEPLKSLVTEYNNEDKNTRIAVIDYSARALSGTPEEGLSLLEDDIKSGNLPDIIIDSTGFHDDFISELSSEGKVLDLKKIIEKDKSFKDTEFTDKATSLFYGGDSCFYIVPSFCYRSVTGNADELSLSEGWDRISFLEYAGSLNGEKALFYNLTGEEFIDLVLSYDGNELVNFNGKYTAFNSPEYISLLEFAASLPANKDEAYQLQFSSTNKSYTKLCDAPMLNLGDFDLEAVRIARGDYSDLGFPGIFSGGSGVINTTDVIMIVADRACTNECWDFVKNTLLEDYQSLQYNGIPVTSSGYENWLSSRYPSVKNPDYYIYIRNGVEHFIMSPGDDKVDYLATKVNQCNKFEFTDYYIRQIVLSNAQDFFDGMVTAQEAAQSTDREVEEYLKGLG